MHPVNLRKVDLNLLVVLQAVLAERQVTHAADRLNMSQPAVSHALKRLRHLFQDQLVVKCPHGIELTARASELSPDLDAIILEITRILERQGFDPAQASGKVTICAPEGAISVLHRSLLKGQKAAPAMQFRIIHGMEDVESGLKSGVIDLYIDSKRPKSSGIKSMDIFHDELKYVARSDTCNRHGITMEEYLSRKHVAISGGTDQLISGYLKEIKVERNISIISPGYFTAAYIVASSDLIMTLPTMLATDACRLFPLEFGDLPFELPRINLFLSWHARRDRDPINRWIRELIREEWEERKSTPII